jgi:hypothetical protein
MPALEKVVSAAKPSPTLSFNALSRHHAGGMDSEAEGKESFAERRAAFMPLQLGTRFGAR